MTTTPAYYESPSGKKYMKDNANVPSEHLIGYIKCMNYFKFMHNYTKVIEIDRYPISAKCKKYKGKKKSKRVITDEELINMKILKLLGLASYASPVICIRPGSVYLSGCMPSYIQCGTTDIDDLKYDNDSQEVKYNGYTFYTS